MKYYIYCFVNNPKRFDLTFFGLNDAPISLIAAGEVAAIVSKASFDNYVATPKNLATHQNVIEEVMKQCPTVLPVDFGTITQSGADLKKSILKKKQRLILKMLRDFENKQEFDIRVTWQDISKIFLAITTNDEKLKIVKNNLLEGRSINPDDATLIGQLIAQNFDTRKKKLKNQILASLGNTITHSKEAPILGDDTFINLSLLVPEKKQSQFYKIAGKLKQKLTKEEIIFDCLGPCPPYNFANTHFLFD